MFKLVQGLIWQEIVVAKNDRKIPTFWTRAQGFNGKREFGGEYTDLSKL